MPRPASTTARGYGTDHQKLRADWTPTVNTGSVLCAEPICHHRTRTIHPWQPWDLAHDRVNGGYRGPAHRKCNRAEGGRWAAHCRRQRRALTNTWNTSRNW